MNFIRHSSNHFRFEHFSRGSIIFNAGDQADKFYLILKGRIGVFVPQSSDEIRTNRNELILRQVKSLNTLSPMVTPGISPNFMPMSAQKQPSNELFYENFFIQTPELKKKYFEEELFVFKMIKVLSEKDCFGEVALSNNKPRSASILALDDLSVLTLLKDDFERDFAKMIRESQEKFEFFQKLFEMNQNESSSSALMRVIYYFNELEMPPNQMIFHEGEKANAFYVIVRGEVEITRQLNEVEIKESFNFRRGTSKKGKKMLNIAKLGAFNLVGEEDIIEEKERRSYSAMTVTFAKLYTISKKVKKKFFLWVIFWGWE